MGWFVHTESVLSGALLGRREDLSVAGTYQSVRVLKAWAQEHSKPGQQDDDFSTVSPRLAVLPAGLKHSASLSPPWTPCTANTGDWLYLSLLHTFTWQSQDVTQQENKGQSATDCICTRSVTFSKRGQQWQLSIPVLTAFEAHGSCRAGKYFSFPCTSMCSQEVEVFLRLLCVYSWGYFSGGLSTRQLFTGWKSCLS